MQYSDKELANMENPEYWNLETSQEQPPAKHGRAVLSVAFSREDFEQVAAAAEQEGMRTSEFVREAALNRARQQTKPSQVSSCSFSTGPAWEIYTELPAVSTRVTLAVRARNEDDARTA